MKKVTITPSTSTINTIDVRIENESHTVAAPIIERLNDSPHCEYAAYKIDHPTDKFVSIKIKGDETKNAKEIFKECVMGLIDDIESVISQVKQSHY